MAAAQAGFANTLLKTIVESAPNLTPSVVVSTGATELRTTFSGADLQGVLVAYAAGIQIAFAVCIAVVGMSVPIALLSRWRRMDTTNVSGAA